MSSQIVGVLAVVVVVVVNAIPVHAFTLITFDVDGTLIQGSGQAADTSAHSRAFSYAVAQVLGTSEEADGDSTSRVVVQPVAQALPRELYHGSTDGLILLRLARATLAIEPQQSFPLLDTMMQTMYDYIAPLSDDEVSRGIAPLPNVIETLQQLSTMKDRVMCGLVTGNVEGIARRKMSAVGIYQTGALASPAPDQTTTNKWIGSEHMSFLGGFGSDYCSGNIDTMERNYLDRCEQIKIAVNRCQTMLLQQYDNSKQEVVGGSHCNCVLERVVHVGDAPADVLAARSYAQYLMEQQPLNDNNNNNKSPSLSVTMIATATGSYTAQQLQQVVDAADGENETIPGWNCIVLPQGIADPRFLDLACGLHQSSPSTAS